MEIEYIMKNGMCLTNCPFSKESEELEGAMVNSGYCGRCKYWGGVITDGIIKCNHPTEEKKEESKSEFEVGDVVRLNGQDTVMTIIFLYHNKVDADVAWLGRDGALQRECLPIGALYKVGE